jgi:hypothetical protein
MAHPLVDQLRFARSEFRRGLEGFSDEEARRRFLPMNCLSLEHQPPGGSGTALLAALRPG